MRDTDDLGQLVRRVPLVGEMYRKGATSRVTVGDDVECAVEQLIEALEDITQRSRRSRTKPPR